MIEKIISGGQIGADIAGLRAAHALGVPTGGTAPKGWLTLEGPKPYFLGSIYGLREHISDQYPPRTRSNVRDSDGTVRFATHFNSYGEMATLAAIRTFHKPYIDIPIKAYPYPEQNYKLEVLYGPEYLVNWIKEHNVKILNVSGNALREIEPTVEEYMKAVIISCGSHTPARTQ